jgi:hypothetical protein
MYLLFARTSTLTVHDFTAIATTLTGCVGATYPPLISAWMMPFSVAEITEMND